MRYPSSSVGDAEAGPPFHQRTGRTYGTARIQAQQAHHAERAVLGLADAVGDLLPEARPAGAGIEFRLRGVDRQVAAGTGEDTLAVLVEQRAGARIFRALLAQHVEGGRRQDGFPLVIRLGDLEFFGRQRGLRSAHDDEAVNAANMTAMPFAPRANSR